MTLSNQITEAEYAECSLYLLGSNMFTTHCAPDSKVHTTIQQHSYLTVNSSKVLRLSTDDVRQSAQHKHIHPDNQTQHAHHDRQTTWQSYSHVNQVGHLHV